MVAEDLFVENSLLEKWMVAIALLNLVVDMDVGTRQKRKGVAKRTIKQGFLCHPLS